MASYIVTRALRWVIGILVILFVTYAMMYYGGGDPITPFRTSVERILQLAGDDLEVRIFADARHSIYNEINRDEVVRDVIAWLEGHL